LFSEEEWAVWPAIDIHDSVLAATLGTEPVPQFYAQTFTLLTNTYLTTYHCLLMRCWLLVQSYVKFSIPSFRKQKFLNLNWH